MKKSTQLRVMCRRLGMTLVEFSTEIGVSPRMLDNYVASNGKPPSKVMNSAYWVYFQRTGKN
ncbi:XRE family transcriptional regulator, partial [Vibrio parahaemolyticus]|nr:XRE family transcriptional regulator [Vibrio parahaemolyticus]